MNYLNNLIKNDRRWLTGTRLIALAVLIGVIIFYGATRPAWTAPGVANADGVSYRIEGQNIVLSWGEKPTGGYAITIDSLEVRGNTLTATYSLKAPAPGDIVTQAITYPEAKAVIPGAAKPAKVELIRNGTKPPQTLQPKLGILPSVGSLDNLKKLLEQQAAENGQDYQYYFRTEAQKTKEVAAGAAAPADSNRVASEDMANDYSKTNLQVTGVDEADVVKTDGNYIYQVNNQEIKIIRAYPVSKLQVLSTISFADSRFTPQELYVDGSRLVVIGSSSSESYYPAEKTRVPSIYPPPMSSQFVTALVYDITDRTQVKKIREVELEGNYISSRKVGNRLYLAANKWINYYRPELAEDVDLRPYYRDSAAGDKMRAIDYSAIRYFPECVRPNYLVVAGINLLGNEPAVISTYLGSGENIYCSEKNLYVAISQWQYQSRPLPAGKRVVPEIIDSRESNTRVYRLALNDGRPECTGQGEVPGTILNQFSMDEHNGCFRIATTTGEMWRTDEGTSKNNIYVLNDQMTIVGRLENIAPGERIYSTRFMGDRVYMVTFRNVDPLFVIDLKDPKKPVVLGALKIPGYSDYLHPYDDHHIIGFGKDTVEVKTEYGSQAYYTGMKIAMFDVTDVTKPKEMFKEIIGDRGTESALLRNHKALLFSRERSLLAFPVTVMKARQKAPVSGMPQYGEFEFQGAYVYRVDLKNGFQLQAQITHLTEEDYLKAGGSWYNSGRNVERILYINDGLYTLSQERVRVHNLNTFKEAGNLWF
ncbi:MAG: beta-propeller domain-containing protein [Syntrophomonadales bacterium]